MEKAYGIEIPIEADRVMSPLVTYGYPLTAIYFETEDEQYGRITFEGLDSIKASRGEYMPFDTDYRESDPYYWVYKVENSRWLNERYLYEKKYYKDSYEFNGNVEEMLTDFSHFVFSFHDEFIEVIAKGFWYEKDKESLFGKDLSIEHPLVRLSNENQILIEVDNHIYQVRSNTIPIEELKKNTTFCSQKLMEFFIEGSRLPNYTLLLSRRNGKLVSTLREYFGNQEKVFDGVAKLQDIWTNINYL